jgi:hypothetical protein
MGDNGRMGDRLEERGWNDQIGDNGIKGRGGREGGGGGMNLTVWQWNPWLALRPLVLACFRIFCPVSCGMIGSQTMGSRGGKEGVE